MQQPILSKVLSDIELRNYSEATKDVYLRTCARYLGNPWPTISANLSLGMMTEKELRLLIEHVKGIDQGLSYYRGDA